MPPRHLTLPSAQTASAREAQKSFYCQLCSKGYSRMNDYEAHLSSYDHSHKQRLKDMKAMVRDPTAGSRARKAEAKADGLISIKLPGQETATGGGGSRKAASRRVVSRALSPKLRAADQQQRRRLRSPSRLVHLSRHQSILAFKRTCHRKAILKTRAMKSMTLGFPPTELHRTHLKLRTSNENSICEYLSGSFLSFYSTWVATVHLRSVIY
uniref:C2H2-type domain-containing protein n=1 Tax=Fusarium oxysporum (strain Fo5176) TaxID=660025 RepID=A0A0D2YH45_FUSOF